MWYDDGYYDSKYKSKMETHHFVPIPEEFIETGRAALKEVLPRESESRAYDFVQLSLIWLYNIIKKEDAMKIVKNIEDNLVREKGVIRYPGDLYYSSNQEHPFGNEAQWPLGFAWLSIAFSKLAIRQMRTGDISDIPKDLIEKSEMYLDRLESVMTDDGRVPELYIAGGHNFNIPLAWA